MRLAGVVLALVLAGCAAMPMGAPPGRQETHSVPVPGAFQTIVVKLCRPGVPGVLPLAVINHGSPAQASERATARLADCGSEAVTWFTRRGFAVLLPLRRGYGASGGDWAEGYGRCSDPFYAAAGRETARDIRTAIDFAIALPDIRPEGVLVVGQSAGGWGAMALAAEDPPMVGAFVSMAGGRGGWAQGRPNTNCRPERLVSAAGEYGRAARLPMLWVYTANDSFFDPDLALAMHQAFTAAGGAAELEVLGPFGRDGHSLFFGPGGSATWGPVVEAFLTANGYASRSATR
ncbi:MAG: dienelactone hydrolase family protein [Roseomonas sp.]|nr:dienelactone hydrolase family protein [Roseomonas sp.]